MYVLLGELALLEAGTKVAWSSELSAANNFIRFLCAFFMPNLADIQLTRCIDGNESCVYTFVSVQGETMLNDCNACIVIFCTSDVTLLKFDQLRESFLEIRNMWC